MAQNQNGHKRKNRKFVTYIVANCGYLLHFMVFCKLFTPKCVQMRLTLENCRCATFRTSEYNYIPKIKVA